MSEILPPVVARLYADIREFQAKMGEAQAEMGKLDAAGAGTFTKLTKGGMIAAAGVGVLAAGAVEFGKSALEAGSSYEASMTRVRTAAGLTKQQATDLGNALLATGGQSEFSAAEMMDAYKGVAGQLKVMQGAALTTAQATEFLKTATELATASGNSLGNTAQDLTTVMRAYGTPLEGADKVSNRLFKTSTITGISMDSLASTLQRLHMRLGAAAPSIQDSTALLADFNQNGISGDRAIRTMSSSLTKLMDPTGKSAAAFAQLTGKTLFVNGQFIGLRNVIGTLHDRMAGLNQEQQLTILGQLGLGNNASALSKIIDSGTSTWDKGTQAIHKNKSALQGANAQQQTLEGQLKTFKSAWKDFVTVAGIQLLPVATTVTKWANRVLIPALSTLITGKPTYGPEGHRETIGSRVGKIGRDIGMGALNLGKLGYDLAQTVFHLGTGQVWRLPKDVRASIAAGGRIAQAGMGIYREGPGGGTVDPVWKHELQVAGIRNAISIKEAGRLGFRPGNYVGIDHIKVPVELKRGSKVEVTKIPKANVNVKVNGKTVVKR